MSSRKRSFVVHSEARQLMISDITEKCDEEAKQNSLRFPVKQATKRAVDYCGKSENFIIKIRKEAKRAKQLKDQGEHESGKEIFYLDETWLDSNINVRKCWQSDDIFGAPKNYSAGNHLILLHAGAKMVL
ncbi:hypothetical protein C0J52_18143 [Blattella germanica]|nr:hypothetical protein C0J52_18143 [Blattella germanica]